MKSRTAGLACTLVMAIVFFLFGVSLTLAIFHDSIPVQDACGAGLEFFVSGMYFALWMCAVDRKSV